MFKKWITDEYSRRLNRMYNPSDKEINKLQGDVAIWAIFVVCIWAACIFFGFLIGTLLLVAGVLFPLLFAAGVFLGLYYSIKKMLFYYAD